MIASGTQDGWEQLRGRLQRFIASRVAACDVDDVLQNTLVRIQRGLPKLRESERFGPWAYQVTRSEIVDHYRRGKKNHDQLRLPVDGSEEASQETEVENEVTTELVACVSIFVAELSSPYREAVTLTELQGLSQEEAAKLVGISLSGMKSRVQRARQQLRAMFDECCSLAQDSRGHVIECDPRQMCGPKVARPKNAT